VFYLNCAGTMAVETTSATLVVSQVRRGGGVCVALLQNITPQIKHSVAVFLHLDIGFYTR